jgi:molybdopterin-containing oxidoreductase family iron-sulfur binding subunit
MKTIPPTDTTPHTGRLYWRGLDQLADTPEFKQFLQREFPENASELTDPVSRRHFVKIMSASFALAGIGLGATGCRRPEDKLLPFGKAVEGYVHGKSQFFATAMPSRGGAIPLVAKSYEGRPLKVEGNPLFPGGNGGTDRFAQASILNLYDPDRATRFAKGAGKDRASVTSTEALEALAGIAAKFSANQGEGLAFLGERTQSPSRRRLHQEIAKKMPKAKWFLYDAIDSEIHQRAATQAFGKSVKPLFRYDAADTILALDCDFIGGEEDAHNNIRNFTSKRKIENPGDKMNRLYAVESLFTLTGLNADHRLRIAASSVIQVAAAIAAELGINVGTLVSGSKVELDKKWIAECAKDLQASGGKSLVVAGIRQPMAVHLIVSAINAKLGNIGKTVELVEAPAMISGEITELAEALNKGAVDTLVIAGANPIYNAPADLDWTATQRKAKTVVRLGYYEDETGAATDWHFPQAHYLESWSDGRTSDGTLVPIQPLIAPLFGGLTDLEFLARVGGLSEPDPKKIVRETFFSSYNGGEADWNKYLHDGFAKGTALKKTAASWDSSSLREAIGVITGNAVSKDNLEVVLYRDAKLDDGRYANNGWLQELPDPITKIVWDNAVLVSRATARALNVENGDVVEVSAGGKTVKGAIWTQPGMADYSLGIALGYGREKVGRVGVGTGFDAYPLYSSKTGYIVRGATLKKVGGDKYPISCTQTHWSMEGRAIVREANLEQFKSHPDFAEKMNAAIPPRPANHVGEWPAPIYENPLDKAKKTALHQWGMAIDLNSCVGCGTCVVACQAENNIPIVGKDLVARGREMHWMRIDRYYSADPKKRAWNSTFKPDEKQQFEEWIDDVQAVNQPMLCQHCEAAPCESVCPVNATVHDHEGLNVMAYNRCVGTRYCSNNCPYKVRRFNYLDYNKRSLKELKGPFYPTTLLHSTEGEWDLARWWKDQDSGMRQSDEWDLIRMLKNPDVTVRMRGVMEKCTFCVQRIEGAKIAQKVKAGASGDVVVPDGTIKTACEQACPAGAIVFGNVADENSRVSKLKAQQRDYSVLDFLETKPRTTYLAKVRNPNPAMPDYMDSPLTLEEFKKQNGDPFKHGHSEGASKHGEPAHAGEKKGAH